MSKIRLVAFVLLVVAVVVVLNIRHDKQDPTPPVPTPTVTVTESATPSDSPEETSAVTETPTSVSDPTAETIARQAVTAWQNPDTAARQAALAPLVLPELLDLYAYTDPENVPQAPVTTVRTVEYGEGSTTLTVTLEDGTALTVIVDDVYATGDYRVTAINPAE